MKLTRSLIKHLEDGTIYCIEADESGFILAALDVTSEANSGGLCSHILASLPLAGNIEEVERLNRDRDRFEGFEAACGNVHHLMAELLDLEREHRAASALCAMAEARFRSLKKDVDLKGTKVHELLNRIAERKPLPLFAAIEG